MLQIELILECQSDRVIYEILKHEDKTNQLANNNRFKVIIKLRNKIFNCLYGNIIQQQFLHGSFECRIICDIIKFLTLW